MKFLWALANWQSHPNKTKLLPNHSPTGSSSPQLYSKSISLTRLKKRSPRKSITQNGTPAPYVCANSILSPLSLPALSRCRKRTWLCSKRPDSKLCCKNTRSTSCKLSSLQTVKESLTFSTKSASIVTTPRWTRSTTNVWPASNSTELEPEKCHRAPWAGRRTPRQNFQALKTSTTR